MILEWNGKYDYGDVICIKIGIFLKKVVIVFERKFLINNCIVFFEKVFYKIFKGCEVFERSRFDVDIDWLFLVDYSVLFIFYDLVWLVCYLMWCLLSI